MKPCNEQNVCRTTHTHTEKSQSNFRLFGWLRCVWYYSHFICSFQFIMLVGWLLCCCCSCLLFSRCLCLINHRLVASISYYALAISDTLAHLSTSIKFALFLSLSLSLAFSLSRPLPIAVSVGLPCNFCLSFRFFPADFSLCLSFFILVIIICVLLLCYSARPLQRVHIGLQSKSIFIVMQTRWWSEYIRTSTKIEWTK